MCLDQSDKIRGRIPGQRRFGEVRIRGEEMLRLTVEVCEIAASAAGDQNLLAGAFGALDDGDPASAFARLYRAHESSGPCAENDRVELLK
jgi:hypothetical protein